MGNCSNCNCHKVKEESLLEHSAKQKSLLSVKKQSRKTKTIVNTNKSINNSIEQHPHFDVFNKADQKCFGIDEKVDIEGCNAIKRLTVGLKFYSSLNISNNNSNHETFSNFCRNIYRDILNDYLHLINIHSFQLEDIAEQLIQFYGFKQCNVTKCQLTERHCIDNSKSIENITQKHCADKVAMFYQKTFDSIHFYLFHLFDAGLRISKDISVDALEMELNDNYNTIDPKFASKCNALSQKQKSAVQARHNNGNNKFNIMVGYDSCNKSCNESDEATEDENTFMDTVYEKMATLSCNRNVFTEFHSFICNEEYDTDAVKFDVQNENCNILNTSSDRRSIAFICEYIKDKQLSTFSFCTGLTFYYWTYYKNVKKIKGDIFFNINDHSGYNMSDLYVQKRYNTFKEEILQNLTFQDYDESVLFKAEEYLTTDPIRKIKANSNESELHFGITYGTPICIENLISVIIYCDFTELSRDFSSTFRAIKLDESLESIKKRNSNYYWLSKILRETVAYFGETGESTYDIEVQTFINKGTGPFFCGMSTVMVVPAVCIRLCSPTSTSVRIEIAMNFAKTNGIIIQLNNNGHSYIDNVSYFDCSLVSNYKEEDERLFFGGEWRIRIQSIRVIQTKENFKKFFHALFIFDCMVNGTEMRGKRDGINITKHDIKVMKKLIAGKNNFGDYVNDTFRLFCNQRTQLIFNLNYIHNHFMIISHLIMNSVERTFYGHYDEYSNKNLFDKNIFDLFKHVDKIVIYSTDFQGYHIYSFSLLGFVTFIDSSSSWTEINIKATCRDMEDPIDSWIARIWSTSFPAIDSICNQLNCNICFKKHFSENVLGFKEDCLIIKRY